MMIARSRLYYGVFIGMVIVLGLLSRKIPGFLPAWVGDVLWGLMIFLIMSFIFRGTSTFTNAISAAGFSLGVEAAKFCHAPWLEAFRYTTFGGLVLGYVFSFYNIFCYYSGIAIGVLGETSGKFLAKKVKCLTKLGKD